MERLDPVERPLAAAGEHPRLGRQEARSGQRPNTEARNRTATTLPPIPARQARDRGGRRIDGIRPHRRVVRGAVGLLDRNDVRLGERDHGWRCRGVRCRALRRGPTSGHPLGGATLWVATTRVVSRSAWRSKKLAPDALPSLRVQVAGGLVGRTRRGRRTSTLTLLVPALVQQLSGHLDPPQPARARARRRVRCVVGSQGPDRAHRFGLPPGATSSPGEDRTPVEEGRAARGQPAGRTAASPRVTRRPYENATPRNNLHSSCGTRPPPTGSTGV
jgi:hypothetical protein